MTTKQNILMTATKLFYLRGYHATGLTQILTESGAPKGSLYHHFPGGKEQLAIEAVTVSKEAVGQKIRSFLEQHDSPIDGVQAHIHRMAQLFDSERGFTGDSYAIVPFGLMAAESVFESEALRLACNAAFTYWASLYEEKLRASGYEQAVAQNISTAVTALIEGAVTLSLTEKSSEPLMRISQLIPALMAR